MFCSRNKSIAIIHIILFILDLIPYVENCGCGGGNNNNNNNDQLLNLLVGYLLAALAGAGGRRRVKDQDLPRDGSRQYYSAPSKTVCRGFWARKTCEVVRDTPLFLFSETAQTVNTTKIKPNLGEIAFGIKARKKTPIEHTKTCIWGSCNSGIPSRQRKLQRT